MFSLGISPGDGLKLLEYHESAWFIKEIIQVKKKNDTIAVMEMAEAARMGAIGASSKANFKKYQQWRANLNNSIADPVESGEETLFDLLKKQSKANKKPLTFWDRMKKK